MCESSADAAATLQKVVAAGLRPTIRSGGHCYEDFVANNPGGAILDVGALSQITRDPASGTFHIGAGAQLWNAYETLYKQYGVTLPGGVCGTVGAGGHISGGGYGAMSRLMGLSSDWLTAVNILTVDKHGKVLPIRATPQEHGDLFRACNGAGTGSFGLVTDFEFAKLPTAPREIAKGDLSFSWEGMTPEKLTQILTTFGRYCETRGQEPDTWGLYGVLDVSHKSSETFSLSTQFCNPDGTCHDLRPQQEFLDLFAKWSTQAAQNETFKPTIKRSDWLSVTATNAGSPSFRRGKYKSAYMRHGFTAAESAAIYKHLTREVPGTELKEATVEIHTYGGAINKPELLETTAVPQRGSAVKIQFITYWDDAAQDAPQTKWLSDFYQELYSGPDADPKHAGTPYWNEQYQGCYINYPDVDMLRYDFWPQLYYGESNYAFLQQVKRRYDPNNVFHHAMSVRL
jgi:FAD/FMN-containing dehydrogenase